jgi:hypothetical protein
LPATSGSEFSQGFVRPGVEGGFSHLREGRKMHMTDTKKTVMVVLAALAVVVVVMIGGCGGGGQDALPVGPRGKVTLPAQTVKVATVHPQAVALTVSTPAVAVTAGGTLDLPVSISDASGVAGAGLILTFDKSVVSCTDVVAGGVFPSGATVVKNIANASGTASATIVNSTGAPAGQGVLLTFKLAIAASATNQSSTLGLSGEVDSTTGKIGGINFSPSPIAIRYGKLGDILGTGNPEVFSAIKILRVAAQLDSAPPAASLWQWDCNGNGAVDTGDAIPILRSWVGLAPWPIVLGVDVTGIVKNATTGAAIPGLVASMASMTSAPTGADGRFTISGVPAGTQTLTISQTGYAPYSSVQTISTSPVDVGTILLTPATTPPTVAITAPLDAATVTTASATLAVTGTSTAGSAAVTAVAVRLNGGNWITATGTTTWSSSVTLTSGANLIEARASAGTTNSTIAAVHVTYTPPSSANLTLTLDATLNTTGTSKVTSITSAQLLDTTGAVVSTGTINSGAAVLPMTGLTAGDYFIRLNNLANDLVPTRIDNPATSLAQRVSNMLNVSNIGPTSAPTYKIVTWSLGQARPSVVGFLTGATAPPTRYAYGIMSMTGTVTFQTRVMGTAAPLASFSPPSNGEHNELTWIIGTNGHRASAGSSCLGCHGSTKPAAYTSVRTSSGWCYKCHYGTGGTSAGIVDPAQ